MPTGASAYLVVRRADGFGDVFALTQGQRYTMGRATTNRIILKDDLCSREHAEVFHSEGHWHLRDMKSLNGTRINGKPLQNDWLLAPHDEVQVGKTDLLFVENMSQLPDMPTLESLANSDSVNIKKRLRNTHYLTPVPPPTETPAGEPITAPLPPTIQPAGHAHSNLNRELALLYRLALDMGSATSYQELVSVVLEGLLEGTPADVGAILSVKEGCEIEVIEYRGRDPKAKQYVRVSEYVSKEVLDSHEAILAEDVAHDRYLKNRESLSDIGATSLICAPVQFREQVQALIHLYCTDPNKTLSAENLEFAVALAKQLGVAIFQLNRQESLSSENQSLRDQLRVESELVGESNTMKGVESQIARYSGKEISSVA